jgi:nitroimidazol reductase NimA-like FMN-containing flavoprotein (pyridoxamine 5'-phosphate oxidase superfamily)
VPPSPRTPNGKKIIFRNENFGGMRFTDEIEVEYNQSQCKHNSNTLHTPSMKHQVKQQAHDSSLKVLEKILTLFQHQQLAVLSTFDGKTPHASIVGFAVTPELGMIYFVTPKESRKFRNIKDLGRAALLIDNRTNHADDFHGAVAVTAVGPVLEVRGADRKAAEKIFIDRHPQLEDFARSADCALCCLKVESYRFVDQFQHVTEVAPSPGERS